MPIHKRVWSSLLYLQTDSGYGPAPYIGATSSDLTVSYARPGDASLQNKVLDSETFREVGDGYYEIAWTEGELGVIGDMAVQITGPSLIEPKRFTVEVVPPPAPSLANPSLCVISGSVIDLGGKPSAPQEISVWPSKVPASVGESLLSGMNIRTTPDAYGNFSLALVRGAKVVITMLQSGLRHTITVPDAETARLIDVLPPLDSQL